MHVHNCGVAHYTLANPPFFEPHSIVPSYHGIAQSPTLNVKAIERARGHLQSRATSECVPVRHTVRRVLRPAFAFQSALFFSSSINKGRGTPRSVRGLRFQLKHLGLTRDSTCATIVEEMH